MNENLTYKWVCDFEIAALDETGKEVQRIDLRTITENNPELRFVRGKTERDKQDIYLYDKLLIEATVTEEIILENVAKFFQHTQITNKRLLGLWYDLCIDYMERQGITFGEL